MTKNNLDHDEIRRLKRKFEAYDKQFEPEQSRGSGLVSLQKDDSFTEMYKRSRRNKAITTMELVNPRLESKNIGSFRRNDSGGNFYNYKGANLLSTRNSK